MIINRNTRVRLTAIPDEGYQFNGWNNGETENPFITTVNEIINYNNELRALFSLITGSDSNSGSGTEIDSGSGSGINYEIPENPFEGETCPEDEIWIKFVDGYQPPNIHTYNGLSLGISNDNTSNYYNYTEFTFSYENGKGILKSNTAILYLDDNFLVGGSITFPDNGPGFDTSRPLNYISHIILPNSIKTIGSCFKNLRNIISVYLPNELLVLGESFSNCYTLQYINVPNTVRSLNIDFRCNPFDSGYEQDTIIDYNGTLSDWCNKNYNIKVDNYYHESSFKYYYLNVLDNINLTNLIINSETSNVKFSNCLSIKHIQFEDVIDFSIKSYTFAGCKNLQTITIGNTITEIESNAFKNCISLYLINGGNSITSIGDYAFQGCISLQSINISNTVETIGNRSFRYTNIINLIIPNSVRSIGPYAFCDCNNLESIYIPNSVETIGEYAIGGHSLQNIHISNSISTLDGIFVNDSNNIVNIELDGTLNDWIRIANYNNILKKWTLTLNGTLITNLTLPNNITSVPDRIFAGCTSITAVTFNENIVEVGVESFKDCINLETLYNYSYLENTRESSFENTKISTLSLPNIENIGPSSFKDCSYLSSITFGQNLSNINTDAFYRCTSLSSINIPSCSISARAFRMCTNLQNVIITESSENHTIGNYAFQGCLTAFITIPNNINYIGTGAFDNVAHIEYHGAATGSPWGAFSMN